MLLMVQIYESLCTIYNQPEPQRGDTAILQVIKVQQWMKKSMSAVLTCQCEAEDAQNKHCPFWPFFSPQ